MALQPSSRTFAALAVVLVVAFSGCSAVQFGQQDMTAEEIGEKAQQKYDDIGVYTGTMTTEMVMGNDTQTTTAKVWANQSGDELRHEYVSPEAMNGTVLVSNGSTMWMYNATKNEVRKTDIPKLGVQGTTPDYGKVIENILENYEVSYDGSEEVNGRSTHVLALTPKENSSMGDIVEEMTIWFDKETWFPVKRHSVASFDNESFETTMTYSNLTFDADVPADTFEFEPPADAEVVETEMPDTYEHDTVEQADANVSFDVTEPGAIPDGYELESIRTTFMDGNATASLSYRNESGMLAVAQSNRTAVGAGADDGEAVTIGSVEGTYDEFGSTGIVKWSCDGTSYTVSGSLPKSELLAVADSLACE
jgi:outer membrane lipoprotein-sorting protein